MSFLKIICARPGFMRAGVAHDAVRIWPAEAFSADAWDRLRDEPLLTVTEVTDAEAIAHADLR
ncbi:hypothetical protein V5F77_27460, partial [Xanthobacter sp. DSM 24535]|uniref:hypothetical protein n=1 Tax=Roseixanthobacter psychrophilus TaxID=3119917 RepID=UPI00372BFF12